MGKAQNRADHGNYRVEGTISQEYRGDGKHNAVSWRMIVHYVRGPSYLTSLNINQYWTVSYKSSQLSSRFV